MHTGAHAHTDSRSHAFAATHFCVRKGNTAAQGVRAGQQATALGAV